MHEAAKNKREADANRARLEAEIKATESMVENDLNNERRKKLQEKQRVRRQVEDEITQLTSELFSKKVCGVGCKGARLPGCDNPLPKIGNFVLNGEAKQGNRPGASPSNESGASQPTSIIVNLSYSPKRLRRPAETSSSSRQS